MTEPKSGNTQRIWTRDGLISLKPLWQVNSLGTTHDERLETMIDQYATGLPPHLRDSTAEVYRRAYRRAGLLAGSPDDFDTALPTEPGEPEPAAAQPGGATDGSQSTGTDEPPY